MPGTRAGHLFWINYSTKDIMLHAEIRYISYCFELKAFPYGENVFTSEK
jgi:hypothetical protein